MLMGMVANVERPSSSKAYLQYSFRRGVNDFFSNALFSTSGSEHRIDSDDLTEDQLDYAEQAGMIAKRARLAMVNRQITELEKALKTITTDFRCADAQLMIAEASASALWCCFQFVAPLIELQNRSDRRGPYSYLQLSPTISVYSRDLEFLTQN